MRPEKVSSWRERLPPPFDKPSPPLNRRASATQLEQPSIAYHGPGVSSGIRHRRRRDSAPGALDQPDRKVIWLRYIHARRATVRQEKSSSAVQKLKILKRTRLRRLSTVSTLTVAESNSVIPNLDIKGHRSISSKAVVEEPTRDELSALACECFPPIEESRVIITEYSENALRTSYFTLEEVLASEYILQRADVVPRVRWIYVEYYKMGTFWGSDYRFSQWGTDPALFEKSPILLLQQRLADLDRKAGRPPLEEQDITGELRRCCKHRRRPLIDESLNRLQAYRQILSRGPWVSGVSGAAR